MPDHLYSTQKDMDDWYIENSNAQGHNSALDQYETWLKSEECREIIRKVLDKKCPRCGGSGSYADHAPDPHEHGCTDCPIEVQCDCNSEVAAAISKRLSGEGDRG